MKKIIICFLIASIILSFCGCASSDYKKAVKLYNDGELDEAEQLFIELGEYKESINYIDKIDVQRTNHKISTFSNAKIGDIIYYGKYEQDGIAENGKEPIAWIVLAKENNRIMVLTRYVLDCISFGTENPLVWDTSSARKWLNSSFLQSAFSSAEISHIPVVTVNVDINTEYPRYKDEWNGIPTEDQVFLLSIKEAKTLVNLNDRLGIPTQYVKATYPDEVYVGSVGYEWVNYSLRTPGYYPTSITDVRPIKDSNDYIDDVGLNGQWLSGIRPVIWIDLGS